MQRAGLEPHEQHETARTGTERESARPVAEIEADPGRPARPAAGALAGAPRRGLSMSVHAPLELALGAAAVTLPLVLGLGWTAIVVSGLAGAILIGLAVASFGSGSSRGRIGPAAHMRADQLIVLGLAASTVGFAVAGRASQGVYFAILTVGFAALTLATRYTAR